MDFRLRQDQGKRSDPSTARLLREALRVIHELNTTVDELRAQLAAADGKATQGGVA